MKTLLISVFMVLLFSGMKPKQQDVYSIDVFPLHDTLVPGVENEIQVLLNHQPDTVSDSSNPFSITITGANLRSAGHGKYIAVCGVRNIEEKATLWISKNHQTIFQTSLIIPIITPALKKRVDKLIAGGN